MGRADSPAPLARNRPARLPCGPRFRDLLESWGHLALSVSTAGPRCAPWPVPGLPTPGGHSRDLRPQAGRAGWPLATLPLTLASCWLWRERDVGVWAAARLRPQHAHPTHVQHVGPTRASPRPRVPGTAHLAGRAERALYRSPEVSRPGCGQRERSWACADFTGDSQTPAERRGTCPGPHLGPSGLGRGPGAAIREALAQG